MHPNVREALSTSPGTHHRRLIVTSVTLRPQVKLGVASGRNSQKRWGECIRDRFEILPRMLARPEGQIHPHSNATTPMCLPH